MSFAQILRNTPTDKQTYPKIVKVAVSDRFNIEGVDGDPDPHTDVHGDRPHVVHIVWVLVRVVRGSNLSRASGKVSPVH